VSDTGTGPNPAGAGLGEAVTPEVGA
jgi:hypothetical protein